MPPLPRGARAALVAGSLALLACAAAPAAAPDLHPPPAASSAPAPASAAPAPAAPAASASAAPDGDPDLLALPLASASELASLPAPLGERVKLLTPLCAPLLGEKSGKPLVGCMHCPGKATRQGDHRPRKTQDDDALLEPYGELRGAFTEAGADQRAVLYNACTCYGCEDAFYVLRPAPDGGFALAREGLLLGAGDCRTLRRKGRRDLAVCANTFGRLGYLATTIRAYDLGAELDDGKLKNSLEFVAMNNLGLNCIKGAYFVQRNVESWELRDENKDGEDDLVVKVSSQEGTVTQSVLDGCIEEDGADPLRKRGPVRMPPARSLRLVWLQTEGSLKPDKPTRQALEQLAVGDKKSRPE